MNTIDVVRIDRQPRRGDRCREGSRTGIEVCQGPGDVGAIARKKGIPMSGGLGRGFTTARHFTKDIDVVVQSRNLDILVRVAPRYGIKVVWNDAEVGTSYRTAKELPIDVVPEGRKARRTRPRPSRPRAVRGSRRQGLACRSAGRWKRSWGRPGSRGQADVVRVIEVTRGFRAEANSEAPGAGDRRCSRAF